MPKFWIALSLAAALAASAAAGATTDTPEAAVRTLLGGWYEGDAAKAASALSPDFRLTTLRRDEQGSHVDVQTRESLVAAMANLSRGAWDARLGAVTVQADKSGIAAVWAPYTFYINGKKSHCGIETFQLYSLPAGWQIASFADTHLWDGKEANCTDRPH
jgi:hypothetical protein